MTADVRLRRAHALVVGFEGDAAVATHYVTKRARVVTPVAIGLLARMQDWISAKQLVDIAATEAERVEIVTTLVHLLDAGMIVAEGSSEARDDRRFADAWGWGPAAGAFHFGVRGTKYAAGDELAALLESRYAAVPDVPLWTTPVGDATRLPVPDPSDPLFAVLRARRSRRSFADAELPLTELADVLFSGFAIVGFGNSASSNADPLPLKLAPSGGARNPFEAYVCARRVCGLRSGVHRYYGIDHALALHAEPCPELPDLVGAQPWFRDAAALVLLVAHFPRSQRKYAHPGALRVVLLEAGHIAQNLLLVAAARGLHAVPTCAVSDHALERHCELDPLTQAVLHVVAVGVASAAPSDADFARYEENPRLPGWASFH